jgi:hypothetical protein
VTLGANPAGVLAALILLSGCGGTLGEPERSDGGVLTDAVARHDEDARVVDGTGKVDGAEKTEADSNDAAIGCDSGSPSVKCVSAADSTHLNGPIAVDDQNVYWAAIGQGPYDSVIMVTPPGSACRGTPFAVACGRARRSRRHAHPSFALRSSTLDA